MRLRNVVILMLFTAGLSALGGVFFYRWLTVEDEDFRHEQVALKEQQAKLIDTLEKSKEIDTGEADEAGGKVLTGTRLYNVQAKGMSAAVFASEAPLETVVGTTTKTWGEISVDFNDLTKVQGEIDVDIASLRTGIDLRDEHLRSERWLHVEKFPTAKFELERFEPYSPGEVRTKQKVRGTAHGKLTIKGITRPIEIPVTARFFEWTPDLKEVYVNGDVLRLESIFDVKLSDYGIDAGALLGRKISNLLTLTLKITALTEKPTVALGTAP